MGTAGLAKGPSDSTSCSANVSFRGLGVMQCSNLIDNGVPKSIQRILNVCRSDCVDKKEGRVAKPLPCRLDTQTGVLSCLARCCLHPGHSCYCGLCSRTFAHQNQMRSPDFCRSCAVWVLVLDHELSVSDFPFFASKTLHKPPVVRNSNNWSGESQDGSFKRFEHI